MPGTPTSEAFEAFLRRLSPDREIGGRRYVDLKRRLTAVFRYRRCLHPEDLADQTIDRAAQRLLEMGDKFVGNDPARFAFGVAWNVARESFRQPATLQFSDGGENRAAPEPETDQLSHDCLEGCLQLLAAADKSLVLSYHESEGSARIRRRSHLARDLGLSANALRLKVHRLTARLRECVFACVKRGGWKTAGAES